MNRVEFMRQLESLLRSIAPTEREEALQYYNDYFDDAGKENEQEVIEALGNPARVAENIKRDLLGSGYGEGSVRKALASDRALVEYGKEVQDGTSEETAEESADTPKSGDLGGSSGDFDTAGGMAQGSGAFGNDVFGSTLYESGTAGASGSTMSGSVAAGVSGSTMSGSVAAGASGSDMSGSVAAGASGSDILGNASIYGSPVSGNGAAGNQAYRDPQDGASAYNTGVYGNTVYSQPSKASYTQEKESGVSKGKKQLPGWAMALIIVCLIFVSPFLLGTGLGAIGLVLGLAGAALGVIAAWFATIVGFGVAVIAMFIVFVVLLVVGFLCLFTNPWVGMAMVGSGLVCGGLGVLFLMLTVGMAGVVTPAIFRGIGRLFRFLFQKSEKGLQRG